MIPYSDKQKEVVSQRLARQIRFPMKQQQPMFPDPWHTSVDVVGNDATWWGGNHQAAFDMKVFKDLMWEKHGISVITGLRVERLHDISGQDCDRCGVTKVGLFYHPPQQGDIPDFYHTFGKDYSGNHAIFKTKREAYEHFWRKNHGDASWEANEWVWVVDFRQIGDGLGD